MKRLIFILALLASFNTFAQICDLSSNEQAVVEVNESNSRGEMRGEDHLVELKRLQEDRFELIVECLRNEEEKGLARKDLLGTKEFISSSLALQLEALDESIRLNLENDRINIALQLRMERDILLLETRNLESRIDNILKDASIN